jgi:hypothetical protein
MDDNMCLNCGTRDPERDIQGGLCADCFAAMPEGQWLVAGTWNLFHVEHTTTTTTSDK